MTVQGCTRDYWPIATRLIQGSVLSILLASLYLAGLQDAIRRANGGVRWYTHDGQVRTTHSRWYADDGALLAESCTALQRMINATTAWARLWRVAFREDADKTAVMCTRGSAVAARNAVYMSMPDGSRPALPVVGSYRYLGPPLRCDLAASDLVKELLHTGRVGAHTVTRFATRHGLAVTIEQRLPGTSTWKAPCELG